VYEVKTRLPIQTSTSLLTHLKLPPRNPHAYMHHHNCTSPSAHHDAAPAPDSPPSLLALRKTTCRGKIAIDRAVPRPRPAALRIDPLLPLGQQGRIQQAHPTRSWTGFGQGKDRRKGTEGPACARKGAGRVPGRTDGAERHEPSEGPEQIQPVCASTCCVG
jgi:hypothetical protein